MNLFFRVATGLLVLCASTLLQAENSLAVQAKAGGYNLPIALAMEAATEAIKTCEASGYKVSVSIVDIAGNVKLQAKGDNSTIHTKDSSLMKAYTIVTMGPVFGLDTTRKFAQKLFSNKNNPAVSSIPSIPNILRLAGGVAIQANGRIIAGTGVGGAPGGVKDEVCALAGVNKIRARLPK
jgi:uncharacterized protein GlcG (DUF336 family)